MNLKGRVAIVTGASSGIGAAVAQGLARCGAAVIINYNSSRDSAEGVLKVIRQHGGEALLHQGDVARDEDCREMARAAVARWGRLDILVNNAGATKFVAHSDLSGLSREDFVRIYEVNVVGAYQMARACEAALRQSGDGAIVNISSVGGIEGVGSSIAYAASKGALNTLTLALARALAPNIRVNAVCPGYVATGWFSKAVGADAAHRIDEQQKNIAPLKRTADAEDIAKSVIFLASPDSRNLTGELLRSDTGMHLTIAVGELA